MDNYQMIFSGTGGQGLMLIGDLMAYYYGIIEDKQIVLLKSYGPEARGGACKSELIVDEEECYPAVTSPDFLLAMSQKSYDLYSEGAGDGMIVLTDSDLVKKTDDRFRNAYSLDLTEIAKEKTGKAICANIVALGAITRILDIDPGKMLEVLMTKLPAKILDVNVTAFNEGYKKMGEAL